MKTLIEEIFYDNHVITIFNINTNDNLLEDSENSSEEYESYESDEEDSESEPDEEVLSRWLIEKLQECS